MSHTNIDVVNDGLNDWFCDILDIKDTTYLTQTSEIMESVEWVISCHRPLKNLLLK